MQPTEHSPPKAHPAAPAPAQPAVAPPPSRRRRVLVFALIYLVHLALVLYAAPRRVFLGGEPVMGIDYQTHYEQTRALSEALTRWGKTWVWDPNLLAGVPIGHVFEVDTRLHSYFTHALTRLGLEQSRAYNLFVFLAHLLAPLLLWLAARVLRVGFRAEMVTLGLGVALWHFDSAAHWCWWAGMLSFAIVSYASPLVLALFHRDLEEPRLRYLLPALLLLPLLIITHVWAFTTLLVPLVALYVRAFRKLSPARHARVWGLVLFTIAANLFWLLPILRQLELVAFSGKVGQANPLYLLADYLDIFVNPLHTGSVGTRTFFRFLAFAGAALTFWQWRKERDGRLFAGMVGVLWLVGLAYFASLLPVIRETEPYRFILPAFFIAAVFAGPWLARALTFSWWRELSGLGRAAVVVLALLALPRLAQHVLYFIPELGPRTGGPAIAKPNLAGPKSLQPTPEFQSFRHDGVPDDYRTVAGILAEACAKDEGRVLVEWWVLGEYLRWATNCPIIGGFPDRRLIHESANIFRYKLDPRFYGTAFPDYLVRYNIRYLVMSNPYVALERRTELLEPKRWIGYHRIYRVRHLANYFARGSGKVKASLNRIEVEDAKPEPGTQALLLRFHYVKTMRCSPSCTVAKAPQPDSPVGFISVVGDPKLPSRFVIENAY